MDPDFLKLVFKKKKSIIKVKKKVIRIIIKKDFEKLKIVLSKTIVYSESNLSNSPFLFAS